jgi:hypothetical protein
MRTVSPRRLFRQRGRRITVARYEGAFMGYGVCALASAVLLCGALCRAQETPKHFSLQPDQPESVYAPPELPQADSGVNAGAVHLDMTFAAWTDYVYRGIDYSETGGAEDSPNLQFDGAMKFDLGRYPSFFMGIFTNVYDADPVSNIQEIRPYFGFELNMRPVKFTIGNTFYVYPDRDDDNRSELWVKMALDDSYFFRSDTPVFSPYLLVAYDYQGNTGFYSELGIRHDFEIEDTSLTITPIADVAYVSGNPLYRGGGASPTNPFVGGTTGPDSGFQHYDLGLQVSYGINRLLNIPARYGKLDVKGWLFYTGGIDDSLRADSVLYGGIGLGFSY